jgi:hypothetical protein
MPPGPRISSLRYVACSRIRAQELFTWPVVNHTLGAFGLKIGGDVSGAGEDLVVARGEVR